MAKKSKNDPLAVDAYLATLPRAERESLEALRTLIKDAIPHAEERVSYGTTVMFSLGRDLVGFVSQPKHLSFFMASPKLAQAMKELFYLALDRTLMSVSPTGGSAPQIGRPQPLFQLPVADVVGWRNRFTPDADGRRFLVSSVDTTERAEIVLLFNALR